MSSSPYFDQKLAWAKATHGIRKDGQKEFLRCNKDFVYCPMHERLSLSGQSTISYPVDPKCSKCPRHDDLTPIVASVPSSIEIARKAWRTEFASEEISALGDHKTKLAWIRYDIAAYNIGVAQRTRLAFPLPEELKQHARDSKERNRGNTLYAYCQTHQAVGDMYPQAKEGRYNPQCGCCKPEIKLGEEKMKPRIFTTGQ